MDNHDVLIVFVATTTCDIPDGFDGSWTQGWAWLAESMYQSTLFLEGQAISSCLL